MLISSTAATLASTSCSSSSSLRGACSSCFMVSSQLNCHQLIQEVGKIDEWDFRLEIVAIQRNVLGGEKSTHWFDLSTQWFEAHPKWSKSKATACESLCAAWRRGCRSAKAAISVSPSHGCSSLPASLCKNLPLCSPWGLICTRWLACGSPVPPLLHEVNIYSTVNGMLLSLLRFPTSYWGTSQRQVFVFFFPG